MNEPSRSKLPHPPVLAAATVEESRAHRIQRQQSRFRDRGGIFVPSNRNTLVDILLGKAVPENSSKKPRRSRSRSPQKNDRVQIKPVKVSKEHGGKGNKETSSKKPAPKTKSSPRKTTEIILGDTESDPVAGPSRLKNRKESSKLTQRGKGKPVDGDTLPDDAIVAPKRRGRPPKAKVYAETEKGMAPGLETKNKMKITSRKRSESTATGKGKGETLVKNKPKSSMKITVDIEEDQHVEVLSLPAEISDNKKIGKKKQQISETNELDTSKTAPKGKYKTNHSTNTLHVGRPPSKKAKGTYLELSDIDEEDETNAPTIRNDERSINSETIGIALEKEANTVRSRKRARMLEDDNNAEGGPNDDLKSAWRKRVRTDPKCISQPTAALTGKRSRGASDGQERTAKSKKPKIADVGQFQEEISATDTSKRKKPSESKKQTKESSTMDLQANENSKSKKAGKSVKGPPKGIATGVIKKQCHEIPDSEPDPIDFLS